MTKDYMIDQLCYQVLDLKLNNQSLMKNKMEIVSEYYRLTNESNQSLNECSEDLLLSKSGSTDESEDMTINISVENNRLVQTLTTRGYLSNKRVIRAMLSIDRGVFYPSAASYALHCPSLPIHRIWSAHRSGHLWSYCSSALGVPAHQSLQSTWHRIWVRLSISMYSQDDQPRR